MGLLGPFNPSLNSYGPAVPPYHQTFAHSAQPPQQYLPPRLAQHQHQQQHQQHPPNGKYKVALCNFFENTGHCDKVTIRAALVLGGPK